MTKMTRLTRARFERLRKDAGSVGRVAEQLDYNPTIYSMWESGDRSRKLPAAVIRDLAQLLEVDPEDIATEDGKAIFIEPNAEIVA